MNKSPYDPYWITRMGRIYVCYVKGIFDIFEFIYD